MVTLQENLYKIHDFVIDRIHTLCESDIDDAYAVHCEFKEWMDPETKFTDVIYRTSDIKKRDYITKGKEAYFSQEEPDLINLSIVNSFTTLKDGSVLNVISDQAVYYKSTKNIKYSKNIKITNKEGIITAEVANFFANKNKITLEGNVIFKNNNNIIKGDIAELNTTTNNLKILMKEKTDRVYGKREQKQ